MATLKTYRLHTASIPEGKSQRVNEVDGSLFEAMECADVLGANLKATLDIEAKNEAYKLRLSLQGGLSISCDRCLDPMLLPIDAEYDLTVKYGPEHNEDTDGLLILADYEPYIDLGQIIYDTALLCIPMRHVHSGGCNPEMAELLSLHTDTTDYDSEQDTSLPEDTDTNP